MRTVLFLIALSVAPGVNAAAASLQPPNCALGDTLPIKGVATGNTAEKQPAPPSVLLKPRRQNKLQDQRQVC